jgi:NADPH:quinone reductase-like Zn-dependent oxidoreductase
MKAVRFHAYGDAGVLRCEQAPLPTALEGDALIQVHAAGVNPADTQFRRGDYQAFAPLPLPFIPGWDVAGSVVTAPADSRLRPGDAVFAFSDMRRNGAYAEFIAVRAEHAAHAPRNIPLERAAGVPLAALTAWTALFDSGELRAGQTVLVHAGAGGVGLFAIQLARRAGARVIATASAQHHVLLRRLGVELPIDYRSTDFAAGLRGVDLVLDTLGGETRERSWPVLRKGGILVAIAMPPPDPLAAEKHGVRMAMVAVTPNGERLAQMARLIDDGKLEVVIDSVFPLEQAAEAHRHVERGHACGKVILRVT